MLNDWVSPALAHRYSVSVALFGGWGICVFSLFAGLVIFLLDYRAERELLLMHDAGVQTTAVVDRDDEESKVNCFLC